MNTPKLTVRNAVPSEFEEIGKLMVRVYSQLEGFPKESEQPNYYQMLANIGALTCNPGTELLVAVSAEGKIAGGVVFIGDMQYYGSGIGKLLTIECIAKAKEKKVRQMIIHTTMAMQTAWKMYEKLGFKRSEDLDFMQGELPVFGFRILL